MNDIKKKSCVQSCLGIFTSGFVVLAFVILLAVGGYLFLRGSGAFLIVADELENANAIVVLSGGDETRMSEALSLYEEGYANIIILTETGRELENLDVLHSFDMRIQLMNNGVPSGNILITDHIVGSTVDEAVAVKNLLANRQMNSAIIVTDPYHTKRTSIIFREIFADSPIKLMIRPVASSWYNSRSWFLSPRGWQFTFLEYLKLAGYYLGIHED
jgi:uncharacterized SAM-binding protein YcdF (DUF218 family)